MISAMLVGMQSMPGLVILYGNIIVKEWAMNSTFMVLYAYTVVWLCRVT
jgi:ammonium transporter, Amt family